MLSFFAAVFEYDPASRVVRAAQVSLHVRLANENQVAENKPEEERIHLGNIILATSVVHFEWKFYSGQILINGSMMAIF